MTSSKHTVFYVKQPAGYIDLALLFDEHGKCVKSGFDISGENEDTRIIADFLKATVVKIKLPMIDISSMVEREDFNLSFWLDLTEPEIATLDEIQHDKPDVGKLEKLELKDLISFGSRNFCSDTEYVLSHKLNKAASMLSIMLSQLKSVTDNSMIISSDNETISMLEVNRFLGKMASRK